MSYYNGAYDDEQQQGEYQPARAGWKQNSPTGQQQQGMLYVKKSTINYYQICPC